MKHIIKNWILTGLILYGLFGVSAVSSAGTWEVGENLMPARRWGLGTSVVNGRIYAIGGQDDTPEVSKVEEYDTEKDAWTEKKSMPTGRFRLATAAIGGKIYAMGGTPNNFQALARFMLLAGQRISSSQPGRSRSTTLQPILGSRNLIWRIRDGT